MTEQLEPRNQILDRARRGNGGITPTASQSWSSIERQSLIELLGAAIEIRDALIRIGDELSALRGDRQ